MKTKARTGAHKAATQWPTSATHFPCSFSNCTIALTQSEGYHYKSAARRMCRFWWHWQVRVGGRVASIKLMRREMVLEWDLPSKCAENRGPCLLAFPKRPLELSLASLETEGTFSCLSLPLLTGVKGLERSSQKDRDWIVKREEKESDRRSASFFPVGASLRVRLWSHMLHRAPSFQKPAVIHFTHLSRRPEEAQRSSLWWVWRWKQTQ